jgi:hypothetical protein
MKQATNFKALSRAVGVMAAVVIVVSGVTFAVLQSQQVKLTGNIIQTATANLLVSSDNSHYAATQQGYIFSNLVPGGPAMPISGYPFFLKNSGGTALLLKLAVTGIPSNPDGVDLSKVNILITSADNGSTQSFPLATLIAASATGGASILTPSQLTPGSSAQYTIQVSMTADAMTSSSASLGNIDFAFSGLAPIN